MWMYTISVSMHTCTNALSVSQANRTLLWAAIWHSLCSVCRAVTCCADTYTQWCSVYCVQGTTLYSITSTSSFAACMYQQVDRTAVTLLTVHEHQQQHERCYIARAKCRHEVQPTCLETQSFYKQWVSVLQYLYSSYCPAQPLRYPLILAIVIECMYISTQYFLALHALQQAEHYVRMHCMRCSLKLSTSGKSRA
jgi:hypothetical protein